MMELKTLLGAKKTLAIMEGAAALASRDAQSIWIGPACTSHSYGQQ